MRSPPSRISSILFALLVGPSLSRGQIATNLNRQPIHRDAIHSAGPFQVTPASHPPVPSAWANPIPSCRWPRSSQVRALSDDLPGRERDARLGFRTTSCLSQTHRPYSESSTFFDNNDSDPAASGQGLLPDPAELLPNARSALSTGGFPGDSHLARQTLEKIRALARNEMPGFAGAIPPGQLPILKTGYRTAPTSLAQSPCPDRSSPAERRPVWGSIAPRLPRYPSRPSLQTTKWPPQSADAQAAPAPASPVDAARHAPATIALRLALGSAAVTLLIALLYPWPWWQKAGFLPAWLRFHHLSTWICLNTLLLAALLAAPHRFPAWWSFLASLALLEAIAQAWVVFHDKMPIGLLRRGLQLGTLFVGVGLLIPSPLAAPFLLVGIGFVAVILCPLPSNLIRRTTQFLQPSPRPYPSDLLGPDPVEWLIRYFVRRRFQLKICYRCGYPIGRCLALTGACPACGTPYVRQAVNRRKSTCRPAQQRLRPARRLRLLPA